MGIFSRKTSATEQPKSSLLAQYAPQIMTESYNSIYNYATPRLQRADAMKVSSFARARNLICGTGATIPMALYKKSTGEELGSPVWLEQPSLTQPRFVTLSWTIDSLMMYGVAYWEITETYEDDGRPKRFEWVANTRVTFDLDLYNTTVTQYYVDGAARPMSGLGSLITFQSLTDPILQAGAQVIRSAYDIQKASAISANTPIPSGVLKNNGADLSEPEVQSLLAKWKESRSRGTTAYLTSTLDYQPTSFSPKDMGYKDMLLANSTQIARLFNVPAYYLSADETTSMTYSNVQDERKQFVSLSLQSWITAIEDRLSMNDITNSQNYVRFEIDDTFLRADTIERLTAIEKMLTMGLISVEEARAMEEMTPETGANSAPNVQ